MSIEVPPGYEPGQYVYFVSGGGATKVGLSEEPKVRVRGFQPYSPVELRTVAVVPGSRALEAQIHRQLKAKGLHLHYEWFALEVNKTQAFYIVHTAREELQGYPRGANVIWQIPAPGSGHEFMDDPPR